VLSSILFSGVFDDAYFFRAYQIHFSLYFSHNKSNTQDSVNKNNNYAGWNSNKADDFTQVLHNDNSNVVSGTSRHEQKIKLTTLVVIGTDCIGTTIRSALCGSQGTMNRPTAPFCCDKVCKLLATGRWFSPGTPVSFINDTDYHDIAEILLKVTLSHHP
jgi:endogenous inhibitor of DNA gyrase (YacG/DUF329 family)